MESLGDSGEAISRMLSRRNEHHKNFDDATLGKLMQMVELVDNAYEVMIVNLNAAHDGVLLEISNALNAEIQINNLRNELRDAEIEELDESKKSYLSSVYYMDIVNELEKMGDFIINISQDLEKVYKK